MESCRTHVSGETHWTPRDLGFDPSEASLLPRPLLVWPLGGDSSFCREQKARWARELSLHNMILFHTRSMSYITIKYIKMFQLSWCRVCHLACCFEMVLLCMLCSLAVLELPMQTRLALNLWRLSCLCLWSAGITEVYCCPCPFDSWGDSLLCTREHFSFHGKHRHSVFSLYRGTIYYVLFLDRFILNKFAFPSFLGKG